jgi:hypothetical protein
MSAEPTILFGYWPVIRDEASASSAAKMSGLPVLIFGLGLLIPSVIDLLGNMGPLAVVNLLLGAVGVLLLVCAFRIRTGHHAWLPFLMFPMLGIMMVNLLAPLFASLTEEHTTVWIGRAIGVLLVILALSGLRGWLWKRRNKIKMTF